MMLYSLEKFSLHVVAPHFEYHNYSFRPLSHLPTQMLTTDGVISSPTDEQLPSTSAPGLSAGSCSSSASPPACSAFGEIRPAASRHSDGPANPSSSSVSRSATADSSSPWNEELKQKNVMQIQTSMRLSTVPPPNYCLFKRPTNLWIFHVLF